jgi:para-nitrobenzyl esterase
MRFVHSVSLSAWLVALCVALPRGAAAGSGGDADHALRARTSAGIVEGFELAPGVVAFRGVPFAAPPLGPLRWQPPQPPARWDGVRPATKFGPDCMQFTRNARTQAVSEDCLYLNVYRPADARPGDRRPVHVWIYPGAYFKGAASDPHFDSDGDVRDGIVYVTFNYRVNVFGFLAHPGLTAESPHRASGNYGIMDQAAALRWVQENIAAFGGDPAQVTVSGTSAGGASIGFLLISPLGKGLFRRAIVQSAAAWHPQRTLAQQEAWAVARFGADIEALRAMPAAKLLALTGNAAGTGDGTATLGDGHSGPFDHIDWLAIVDGWVLPESDRQVWQDGGFHTVDLMIGDNENESLMFMSSGAPIPLTRAAYRRYLREQYGPLADEALRIYPAATDADVARQLGLATGDALFTLAAREMSRRMVTRTPNVYRYVFSKHSRGHPVAIHDDEAAYFFGHVTAGDRYDETDVALSRIMQDAKRRFIRTGNPNGGALRNWPAYGSGDPLLEFGDGGPVPRTAWRNDALDFTLRALDARVPSP